VRIFASIGAAVEDDLESSFLYTHNRYVNPEIVLESDNIIIMGLNDKNVWFSITPKEVIFLFFAKARNS